MNGAGFDSWSGYLIVDDFLFQQFFVDFFFLMGWLLSAFPF